VSQPADQIDYEKMARDAVAEAKRSLVWPWWLTPETPAERWLKAKCEKRAARAKR
jgi:hypothetical protein